MREEKPGGKQEEQGGLGDKVEAVGPKGLC